MMQANKILNVSPDATVEEVRRAYYRLAFRFHPDRGGDPQRFVQLCEEYRDQVQLREKHKTALRSQCVYYTSPEDFQSEPIARKQPPLRPAANPPQARPGLFRGLSTLLPSNWRFSEFAFAPLVVTLACGLLVTLQSDAFATFGDALLRYALCLALLAVPGVLASIVSGASLRHSRFLYSQVVLLITACMTIVHPAVLFGGP